MNYNELVNELLHLPRFMGSGEESFANSKELMFRLGNPQDDFPTIHVAGSNGKGSVCAFLASALSENGLKVGLFTSPHLVDIRERFQILGGNKATCQGMDISKKPEDKLWGNAVQSGSEDKLWSNAVQSGSEDKLWGNAVQGGSEDKLCSKESFLHAEVAVRQAADSMVADGLSFPGFFAYLFAMGMVLFQEAEVEVAVIETGLGGRFDATNTIEKPIMTMITSISLEHTEYLGDTIEKIAGEKAGIIKTGVPLVFDGSEEEATKVIAQVAEEKDAPAVGVFPNVSSLGSSALWDDEGFFLKVLLNNGKRLDFFLASVYNDRREFLPKFSKGDFPEVELKIPSFAPYQGANGALAYGALHYLAEKKSVPLTEEKIHRGLGKMSWPGRMEEVIPKVYLDGAHNPDGIKAFLKAVSQLIDQPSILLFAMKKEKDFEESIAMLAGSECFDEVIVTTLSEDDLSLRAEEAAVLFREYSHKNTYREINIVEIENLKDAFSYAIHRKKTEQLLFCAGSLYLVGEVLKEAGGNKND